MAMAMAAAAGLKVGRMRQGMQRTHDFAQQFAENPAGSQPEPSQSGNRPLVATITVRHLKPSGRQPFRQIVQQRTKSTTAD
jgi:hypothetical protein